MKKLFVEFVFFKINDKSNKTRRLIAIRSKPIDTKEAKKNWRFSSRKKLNRIWAEYHTDVDQKWFSSWDDAKDYMVSIASEHNKALVKVQMLILQKMFPLGKNDQKQPIRLNVSDKAVNEVQSEKLFDS